MNNATRPSAETGVRIVAGPVGAGPVPRERRGRRRRRPAVPGMARWKTVAAALLAIVPAAVAAQDIARTLFERAEAARLEGNRTEASKLYEQAGAGGVAEAFGRLGDMAAEQGADKSSADWYERGAKGCDGASQLGLALAHRNGRGREANGDLAYAWLIAAQRSTSEWTAEELQRLAALERDIPAYMSSAQVAAAYCLGLDFFIDACGGRHIMTRLERWMYCE